MACPVIGHEVELPSLLSQIETGPFLPSAATKMRHGYRARKSLTGDRPGDDPRARVIGEIGFSCGRGLDRRHLLRAGKLYGEGYGCGLRLSCPSHPGESSNEDHDPPGYRGIHGCLRRLSSIILGSNHMS